MIIFINKRFLKDLAKIPSENRARIETFIFKELDQYQNVEQIGNMKKLKGHNTFYRVRFGNYRVGIRYENEKLTVERVLHRKEIYKFFP